MNKCRKFWKTKIWDASKCFCRPTSRRKFFCTFGNTLNCPFDSPFRNEFFCFFSNVRKYVRTSITLVPYFPHQSAISERWSPKNCALLQKKFCDPGRLKIILVAPLQLPPFFFVGFFNLSPRRRPVARQGFVGGKNVSRGRKTFQGGAKYAQMY